MAPLSETSAPAEEAEQQKCTNQSVLCVQGDTNPGLLNLWVGQRPEEGSGEPTGPPAAVQGARAVGGLLPGGLGVGSRRSPRWCCVQGPRHRARHLRSGSCIVAFLCLVDDLLQPLAVIFRAVPPCLCTCRSRCWSRYKLHKRPMSQFHSMKEADERRGCRGCHVQRRPHQAGVAKQSPESSPVCGAEEGPAKQRGPRGAMPRGPGLQGGREPGRPAGRRPGEPRPLRQAFHCRALTQ